MITTSTLPIASAISSCWRCCCSGVSSRAYPPAPSRSPPEIELEELRAQRLDLLLDRRADVEPLHDRAEPPRGRDRLQPRHAGAEHEHRRRPDRPRRGHQHRVVAAELHRADQRGAVPGDVRLRGQRVHRLRAADPRDRLHREARRARLRDRPDRLARRSAAARNPISTLSDRSRPISSAVGGATLTTTSASYTPAGSSTMLRARLLVLAVGDQRAGAGAPLDDDLRRRSHRRSSLRTTSGTSATRRSPSAVSLGTPICMWGAGG